MHRRHRARVLDDGHHESRVGVDRATEVDRALQDDFALRIVDDGVERRMLLQRAANCRHDEGKHRELLADDLRVFLALRFERGDIGFVDHGEVDGSLHAARERFGDFAANSAEWHALRDIVLIDVDRARRDGRRARREACARGFACGFACGNGNAALCKRGHVARGHATAATSRGHLLNIDAELLGESAHGGRCECLAIAHSDRNFRRASRKAVAHRQRARHRANDGALIALGGFRASGDLA